MTRWTLRLARCGGFFRPRTFGTVLFLEPVARILVRATRPPVAAPPFGPAGAMRVTLTRRRRRELPSLEILVLCLARLP
jgi:hypothetical protein